MNTLKTQSLINLRGASTKKGKFSVHIFQITMGGQTIQKTIGPGVCLCLCTKYMYSEKVTHMKWKWKQGLPYMTKLYALGTKH